MPSIIPQNADDEVQLRFLNTPRGGQGSGAVRYGAAMYFFQRGMLTERELESYRAASKIDGVSPITRLVHEAERYIGALDFARRSDVMSGIAHWMQGPLHIITLKQVPVLSHLGPALAAMTDRPLAAAIKAASPLLRWVTYPYEGQDIGEMFPRNHAFATLMGEYGPYQADDFDLGLFLIAPHILYRDHYHPAPELYAPLTGPHGWRFQPGVAITTLPAGVAIWNEPQQPHATLTGDVPFLAIYCWTRDVDQPARVIASHDWPQLEKNGCP